MNAQTRNSCLKDGNSWIEYLQTCCQEVARLVEGDDASKSRYSGQARCCARHALFWKNTTLACCPDTEAYKHRGITRGKHHAHTAVYGHSTMASVWLGQRMYKWGLSSTWSTGAIVETRSICALTPTAPLLDGDLIHDLSDRWENGEHNPCLASPSLRKICLWPLRDRWDWNVNTLENEHSKTAKASIA